MRGSDELATSEIQLTGDVMLSVADFRAVNNGD